MVCWRAQDAKSAKYHLKRNCHQLKMSPLEVEERAHERIRQWFLFDFALLTLIDFALHIPKHDLYFILQKSKFEVKTEKQTSLHRSLCFFAGKRCVLVFDKIFTSTNGFSNHKRTHFSHFGIRFRPHICYSSWSTCRKPWTRTHTDIGITKLWTCFSVCTKLFETILNIHQLILSKNAVQFDVAA